MSLPPLRPSQPLPSPKYSGVKPAGSRWHQYRSHRPGPVPHDARGKGAASLTNSPSPPVGGQGRLGQAEGDPPASARLVAPGSRTKPYVQVALSTPIPPSGDLRTLAAATRLIHQSNPLGPKLLADCVRTLEIPRAAGLIALINQIFDLVRRRGARKRIASVYWGLLSTNFTLAAALGAAASTLTGIFAPALLILHSGPPIRRHHVGVPRRETIWHLTPHRRHTIAPLAAIRIVLHLHGIWHLGLVPVAVGPVATAAAAPASAAAPGGAGEHELVLTLVRHQLHYRHAILGAILCVLLVDLHQQSFHLGHCRLIPSLGFATNTQLQRLLRLPLLGPFQKTGPSPSQA
mmetsp:Transcript_61567/g.132813  ORF Transcript_61567/g.132813 Transcript_61567/m.132813 type:complete len:347 (+) Transcript_61567:186-1226(+)